MKYILVINCGSATLKFALYKKDLLKKVASGIVERIGLRGSFIESRIENRGSRIDKAVRNHEEAFKLVLDQLTQISNLKSQISVVGHRVVHGGEEFTRPTVVTPAVLQKLRRYSKLAPLHNPANLIGIAVCRKFLPQAKNIAVFDTGFYAAMPDYAYVYALPYSLYAKYGIRRYGFHGISHRFLAEEAARKLGKPLRSLNLITCHLGSGCSITAVKNGQAVDTSMGFTPLEGLVMSTRAGDIDPAIPLYLIRELKMKSSEVEKMLNFKSGLLGISGFSDMREVLITAGYKVAGYRSDQKSKIKNKKLSQLALRVFIYRVRKYISAYAGILGKVDAIVFTGGIGERNRTVRRLVLKELKAAAGIKVLAIPANEELMIAREVKNL